MADSLFKPTETTADLDQLAKNFKRIAIEWEMFLSGASKWPPHQLQAVIEATIRYFTKNSPQRTADRFRFNTLVHRYKTNSERWRRRLRKLEETGSIRVRGTRGPRSSERAAEDPNQPHLLLRTRLRDGSASTDQLRDLYLTYRQARRAKGQSVSKLAFRSFAEKVGHRVDDAREQSRGRKLELRVDEVGGKVRIAVRAVGEESS